MSTAGLTLVIPEKPDPERDAVAAAWVDAGGAVLRLGAFWRPPALDPATTRVYGPEVFAEVLAQRIGLVLVGPADQLMLSLPRELAGRRVDETPLHEVIGAGAFPLFCKSVAPKLIPSRVYQSSDELEAAAAGLAAYTGMLVSPVVELAWEARAFILHGAVVAWSVYEGPADSVRGRVVEDCVAELAAGVQLPMTCVVDLAGILGKAAVLEFNATWGAGLNGCEASAVVPAVMAASGPIGAARPDKGPTGGPADNVR